jgi:O-antigen/teichoic acid export membrane protein
LPIVSLTATRAGEAAPTRAAWTRYAVTRFATIGDQVLVSLANFGLTLAIGRAYSAKELASYGIGLSLGLMVQGVQRHALIIPLMLLSRARVARRCGGIVSAHLIVLASVLLLGGAGFLIAGQLGAPRYSHQIIFAGAACLVVYVQLEFARAILVKLDRPVFLCAHGAWYAGVSCMLAAGALTQRIAYETLLLALCGTMIASALVIAVGLRPLRLRLGLRLLGHDARRYGGWAAVATATYAGYNHVPLLVLGALAAPVHAAAFVATRSLLQPLQILLRGLDLADKHAFSKTAGAPQGKPALHSTLKVAGLYALVAGVLCVGIASFAEPLILMSYGGNFAGFGPTLIAWTPVFVLLSMAMPFESLIYAREEFRGYYIVRGIGSLAAIALTAILVKPFAEIGAIAACGVGGFIAICGTVVLLLRGTRQ